MKGDDTNKREGTNKVGSDSVKDLWEQTQRIKRDERSSEFTSYVRGRNGCHECESARVRECVLATGRRSIVILLET